MMFFYTQAKYTQSELRISVGYLDVHLHYIRLFCSPRICRCPLVSLDHTIVFICIKYKLSKGFEVFYPRAKL
jgi:hypothetical protein